jgi:glutamate-5-semialdehyde dehydrogenase
VTALEKVSGALDAEMQGLCAAARQASAVLALAKPQSRTDALKHAAAAIRHQAAHILDANQRDMKAAKSAGLSPAMLDRLLLDEKRIAAMATGVDAVAALPDPVGTVLAQWNRPNGLDITRVRVPLGVIGIIYESRPNVTADAGSLCLRSGNARHPARWLGELSFLARHRRGADRGRRRSGIAGGFGQLVPTVDRRRRRHDADQRSDRRDRAARRPAR